MLRDNSEFLFTVINEGSLRGFQPQILLPTEFRVQRLPPVRTLRVQSNWHLHASPFQAHDQTLSLSVMTAIAVKSSKGDSLDQPSEPPGSSSL